MNKTDIARIYFRRLSRRTDAWAQRGAELQASQLRALLRMARHTEMGRRYAFDELCRLRDPYEAYRRRVPVVAYEDIRPDVMRMIHGGRDVLWRGVCRDFAQSSGTSGGKSKYIPVTPDSLRLNHYAGAADSVAHYLNLVPDSRMFSGKGFILGGSYANELNIADPRVHVGDLSATLINRINPVANFFRVPDKTTALMADWEKKLPALVAASIDSDITNISGVPSWFLSVIKEILKRRGVDNLHDVWPNLEVFFHGGISFDPYREIYREITDSRKMHFIENYNASEGFFASQNDFDDRAMLLGMDYGMFFEFRKAGREPVGMREISVGEVYELVITGCNGLWRYRLGDTVRIESLNPLKITIAGRTKSYINAFGEELMEDNAEKAMAAACRRCDAKTVNYTAAPVFAEKKKRGCHQWLIEWEKAPASIEQFAGVLDEELRRLNSDYDAKRQHGLFLDMPRIVTARHGLFNDWLSSTGTHKLGGQRKVPRLSNSRRLIEEMISLNH